MKTVDLFLKPLEPLFELLFVNLIFQKLEHQRILKIVLVFGAFVFILQMIRLYLRREKTKTQRIGSVYRELVSLGLASLYAKPRIKKRKRYIEINFKSILATSDRISKLKPELENLFRVKIFDIEEIRSMVFRFHTNDPAAKTYIYNDFGLSKAPYNSMLLGYNRTHPVTINLSDNSSIILNGRPGAGKSNLLNVMIDSYIESSIGPVKIVVLSSKISDFNWLLTHSKYNVELLDAENSESLARCIEELESLDKLHTFVKKYRDRFPNEPFKDLATLIENKPFLAEQIPQRTLYIFDEAQDFLRITKSDSKELTEMKIKLIDLVSKHVRKTSRFLSCPIVVGTQADDEKAIDIPFKDFKLRISSSTSQNMSRIITASDLLTCKSFTNGKFATQLSSEIIIFKAAFFDTNSIGGLMKDYNKLKKFYNSLLQQYSLETIPESLLIQIFGELRKVKVSKIFQFHHLLFKEGQSSLFEIVSYYLYFHDHISKENYERITCRI